MLTSKRTNGWWFVLLALLPAAIVHLAIAAQIGWYGEDHGHVFGTELTPLLGFHDALRISGWGWLSVHRIVGYLVIGYGGYILGPAGSHVILAGLHIVCGLLLFSLLRRLEWRSSTSALAVAFFTVTPWIADPVHNWTGNGAVVSTLCVLLGCNAWVSRVRARSMAASMGYLALSSALLFLALTVYEIWLTGFVLIWAIDAYLAVTANGVARTSLWGLAWRTLKRCWPVLVPYALYAVLFFFSHRIELHHPRMRLDRVFVVFLSIHARVYHWLFNVPWLSSVRQAKAFLQMPLAWGLAAAFVIIGAFLWIRIRRTSSPMDQGEPATPLGPSLVLAWGCFLGARLFCILGGGVSLQQRHDYGAVMGAAIAAAALLEWLLRRLSAHRVLALSLRGGIVILLLLMTLASAGINVSCRDRSIREDIVYRTLAPVAATMKERQEPKTIVVLCEGGGLYSWYDGWILELRLNHRPYYLDYPGKAQQRALAEAVPVPCFVVRQAFFVNGKIQVQIDRLQNDSAVLLSGGHQYQQRLIPLQEALVYRWNESQHALLLVRGDVLPAFKSGNEPGMTQGL